jgi:glutathione S-transferase
MRMLPYTALVTLLAVGVYFYTSVLVGRAREKFNVKAPAVAGHPAFERAFRVQMNTLEWMPILLPSMWLLALYRSDVVAAALGLVWVGGRLVYIRAYLQAPEKRGTGFTVQAAAAGALWVGALVAIVWRLFQGQ